MRDGIRSASRLTEIGLRGCDGRAGSLFTYVDLEARVPSGHPLRPIRVIVNAALAELSPIFAKLYAPLGRPSIPPEQLETSGNRAGADVRDVIPFA